MADRTRLGSAREPNWLALRPVAQELERWMRASPLLDVNAHETWDEFRARQARSDAELLRKLTRLPGCTVTPTLQGWMPTSLLAGVEVRSYGRLLSARHDWIARVRHEALKAAQLRG